MSLSLLTPTRIKATNVLRRNLAAWNNPLYKIIVNQGGTRSSKTYSIAQMFLLDFLQSCGKILTIVRKTTPSLRSSVMRDVFDILKSMGFYREEWHNRSSNEYNLNGNLIEFMSLDEPQKKRGTKRDYLWINETNEFTYEDYFQLSIRTSGKIVMDYNPSDEYHWIYDKVLTRPDCAFIQSTYKDNPFLDMAIITEIERLRKHDENYWKIYGLGERGHAKSLIYPQFEIVDEYPQKVDEEVYGVDFGFNNPSAVVRVGIVDMWNAYVDELLYQTHLTNNDLIDKLNHLDSDHMKDFRADCAEPDRIEELKRAGFRCAPAMKGKNSVKDGIDVVKRFKIHITRRSDNVIKEIRNYKWKEDKDGRVEDEPVAFMNHAMDAMRYAIGDMIRKQPAQIRWL